MKIKNADIVLREPLVFNEEDWARFNETFEGCRFTSEFGPEHQGSPMITLTGPEGE